MKKLIFIIYLITNTIICPCICVRPSLVTQYKNAEIIIIGRVIDVPTYQHGKNNYLINVIKKFKGREENKILQFADISGDCGFNLKLNETYLIYANKTPRKDKYFTDHCMRTSHISDASLDLMFLNNIPNSLTTTSLIGKVFLPSNDNPIYQSMSVGKGFAFSLKSGAKSYSIKTDSTGVFYLKNIIEDNYKIHIDDNVRFVLHSENEIKITKNKLTEQNIVLDNINHAAGILLDENNKPISGGMVELVPEKYFKDYQNKYLYRTYIEFTDEEGKFNFENVVNGKYYLGVNIDQYPNSDNPYPKTIYKDANELSSATLLELNTHSNYSDVTLRVSKTYSIFEIKITLKTTSGKLWNEASVILQTKDSNGEWIEIEQGKSLGKNGEFIVHSIENQEAWIDVIPHNFTNPNPNGFQYRSIEPIRIETNKNYEMTIMLEITEL